MKICPSCQTRYTDDTLHFCLQDGTPLIAPDDQTSAPTIAFTEEETRVRSSGRDELRFDLPAPSAPGPAAGPPSAVAPAIGPQRSNTPVIVLLTALITILLAGGGVAAWYLLTDDRAARKNDQSNANRRASGSANQNAAATATPTPNVTAERVPANEKETPPVPALDAAEVNRQVTDTIVQWKELAEAGNLSGYMDRYADRVDYYNAAGASRDFVRQDKQKAFNLYDSMAIDIIDVVVKPGPDGNTATAVFDKEWEFDGDKYSAGKVRQQLELKKVGADWLITAEKDLKVYYIE